MYVFLVFYWILPLVGSSTSLNCQKTCKNSWSFSKIRYYAPRDTIMLLYHAIFATFLAYGVSVWGLTYPSMLDSISALQKKILRIVTFSDKTAPSSPIFDCLQVLKFSDIIILYIVSLYLNVCITLLQLILEIILQVSKVCTILVQDSLKRATYLHYVVIQHNMDYALFITQVFGFGILFLVKYEIHHPFQFFGKKSKPIF